MGRTKKVYTMESNLHLGIFFSLSVENTYAIHFLALFKMLINDITNV